MRKKNKITRKKQEQELEKIRGRREGYDDMKQSMKAADTDSNFFFSRWEEIQATDYTSF